MLASTASRSPEANVFPGPPSNSVSPLITARPTCNEMLPGVCPGVCITVIRTLPTRTSAPSSSLPSIRSSGILISALPTRTGAPVAARTASYVIQWSPCQCVAITVPTPPSAAMAASSGDSSSGMSTSSDSPAATSRTMYALLLYGPIGPIFTMRTSPSSTTAMSTSGTFCRRVGRLSTHRRLVSALLRLVRLALFDSADVGEGRVIRHDLLPSSWFHTQLLGDHAAHDASCQRTEAGEGGEAPLQVLRISRLAPDA